MHQPKVCILGGTGFVGRRVASLLLDQGYRVSILTRHRERNRDMLVRPGLSLFEGDVYDPATLDVHFHGSDAVINLVGILNRSRYKNQEFQRAHLDLPELVVEAVLRGGIRRLLHMSAAGASADGPSEYLQTKGAAENLLNMRAMQGDYDVTILRPSVIFGPGDSFTRRFATLLRTIPVAFPLACPGSRLQPVHIDDVAACFVSAVNNPGTFGQKYDLCGPHSYTLYEIVHLVAVTIGVNRRIIRLSDGQSRLQASVMQWFPGKPFTPDNYKSLQVDSVCSKPLPAVFNFAPRAMEDTLSAYLNA
jgi:NADH dehydrogenase